MIILIGSSSTRTRWSAAFGILQSTKFSHSYWHYILLCWFSITRWELTRLALWPRRPTRNHSFLDATPGFLQWSSSTLNVTLFKLMFSDNNYFYKHVTTLRFTKESLRTERNNVACILPWNIHERNQVIQSSLISENGFIPYPQIYWLSSRILCNLYSFHLLMKRHLAAIWEEEQKSRICQLDLECKSDRFSLLIFIFFILCINRFPHL